MDRLEVIERPLRDSVEKKQIEGDLQVSYNNWGHLVLRFIDKHGNGDTLIVLSRSSSDSVIAFVKNYIAGDSLPF